MKIAERAKKVDLGAIVTHPLRIRSLIYLAERKGSIGELAKAFGEKTSDVSYAVRTLEKMGMVHVVEVEERVGSPIKYYRAIQRPMTDNEETEALGQEEAGKWAQSVAALLLADLSRSFESESFAKRPEHAMIRYPLLVDEEGYAALSALHEEMLDRAMGIEAQSAGRLAAGGEGPIFARHASMLFEMPTQGDRERP